MEQRGQDKKPAGPATARDLVIPNPKLKLMHQVREVLRIKHYAIRTEQAYCEWVRRYLRFHGMRSREEMLPGEPKMEAFLSHLAAEGKVAVSTQNQTFSGREGRTSNIELRTSNIPCRRANMENLTKETDELVRILVRSIQTAEQRKQQPFWFRVRGSAFDVRRSSAAPHTRTFAPSRSCWGTRMCPRR